MHEGRVHSKRSVVGYNDELFDDACAVVLEGGEDITDVIELSRDKVARRSADKSIDDLEGVSNRFSPIMRAGEQKAKEKNQTEHERECGSELEYECEWDV